MSKIIKETVIPKEIMEQYKKVPMDLNSSPLEEYFKSNFINQKKNSKQKMTVPLSIPGTFSSATTEPNFPNTFPLVEQNTRQTSPFRPFKVGSLKEEKPIPWPTSFVAPQEGFRHLKNVKHSHWPPTDLENESDIFSMDEDFDDINYHESDFDNDIDINEEDL